MSTSASSAPGPPQNWEQWVQAYGDIEPYLEMREGSSGEMASRLSTRWTEEKFIKIKLPFALRLSWNRVQTVREISVHRYCAPAFSFAFDALDRKRLGVFVYELGGVYADRAVRGGSRLSTHAYAAAIDFNPETNALGTDGEMHLAVVETFEELGFTWGGRWARKDPMHFQYGKEWP